MRWVLLIIVVSLFGLYSTQSWSRIVHRVDEVQAICDKAHHERSLTSEDACGRIQDQTNTEYLCDAKNGVCWVEVK